MKLVEVVADEGDQEAQQLFVALEFPARFGAKVIKHLSIHFQPLTDLGFAHLKRLKKHPEMEKTLVALVSPMSFNDSACAMSTKELRELETMFEAKLTTANALKRTPRARELYEKHTQLWPLMFHASVEGSAMSTTIKEEEIENMVKRLKLAIRVGGYLGKERQKMLSCAWGCVVVDPENDEVVVTSKPAQIPFTLYHPIMVAINGVAERDHRQDTDEVKKDTSHKKQKRLENEDTARSKVKKNMTDTNLSNSYLCTGYDVYLDQEPCAMCAMALVHSRVRRVVFDRANPRDGVLLSSFKLHTIKSINHHYRVFQLPLSDNVEQGCT